jgi:pimeloyl-ACP methyl ester carboxylesterase
MLAPVLTHPPVCGGPRRPQARWAAPANGSKYKAVIGHTASMIFMYGSCWSGVIERLQADGYHVTAPQFPMTALTDDVTRLRHVLDLQDGPTIVAGHSYGGQIVTALRAERDRPCLHRGVRAGRRGIARRAAVPVRAQLLRIAIGAALLRINRLVYNQDQMPVQLQSLFLSPQRSRILMDIPAGHLDTAASGVVTHDLPRPAGRQAANRNAEEPRPPAPRQRTASRARVGLHRHRALGQRTDCSGRGQRPG